MKKKLLSILGCMALVMVLLSLSVSAAYTLPEVHKKDTVYRGKLTDVNTGTLIPFNYEVPEDGAAVIYFYKTTCGNCQYTFSSLNETAWVRNDRIKFYAIESTPENGVEEIRGFQKEYTPNITDVFTWLDSPSPFLCGDYLENAGLYSGGWTWPVVVVITEENGVNTIRAATDGATDVRLLGNTLELLLKEDLGVPKPVPITISVTVDYDKAAELAELTNQKRKENGLPPLQLDKTLTEAAMTRAAEAALFPSEARPDGTASYELIDLYMPNNTMGDCFVGFSCDTAEEFWEDYIDPENYYRWYLTEYEESGGTLVGAGCVYYNNTYYWAVAISDGSAQEGAPNQAGQSTRRYTINTYLTCLNAPGPAPAEVTLYPETSAEVQLLANTRWLDTPLIPTAYNKEVKNSSGKTIATAEMQADGSILVTAQAVGTGKLQISAWDGQETPYTATITVSDVPEYRPHQIHTTTTGGGRIVLSTETAVKDERIKISLSPDEGYWMAGLYVTDAEGNTPQVYYSSDLEYILYMPASDVYITAQFLSNDIPQTPHTVFTSSNGNGELEFFNDRRTHYATTTVTVLPVPNDGYILAGLTATDDYGNSIDITPNADGSYSFQMPASDVMLRPIFAPKEGYAIIVADSYGCTVTPNSATALPGETVTVTITPDEGYELRDYSTNLWEDDSTLTGPNTLTFTMPDHDVELYVYCKPSPITAGTLGDNTRWSYKDGTLTISGEGSMGENENFSALPWYDYLSDIHTVVIEEGVTDIFYRAFSNIDGLTSITIPSTVDYIGEWAFLNDENLTKITFAGSVPSRGMESSVFSGVTAIVYVPANDRSWTDEITRDYSGILTWTHSWSSEVIDPTCTEDGYTLYTCICGDTEKDAFSDALGHKYTDGVCKRCGETDPNHKEPITNPFTDVADADWFYNPVLWAVENKVTGGMTETTFGPNVNCTRAQVVTFLYAAAGKPTVTATSEPFEDVSEADWFYKPVLWAVEKGITGGISATEFGPNQECTRAQVVTFLYAAAGKPEITAGSDFDDVTDTDWYAKPVIWAKANNITGGISTTAFGPNNICTRAQVVTFLYKASQIQ